MYNGFKIIPSPFPVKEAIDKLEAALQSQGVTIYARIDQQKELAGAGLTIPPLEYLLFGKPSAGGPVMRENPAAAIDLPLKVIAWQDVQGKEWIGYNDSAYVRNRFALSEMVSGPLNLEPLIKKVFG